MANKYFNYQGAPWQIIETTDPWGKTRTIAVEMDSTHGAMLNTEEYSQDSDWEYVEASDVRIDEWFLKSDPNDLFEIEEEDDNFLEDQQRYVDLMSKVHSKSDQSSRLKEMLENLRRPTDDQTLHWSIQDDEMNRHERLKASFDESSKNLNKAEDILGMIKARQDTVETPHTVILNKSKYTDSVSLEKAISEMKKRHGDNAHIRIGTHNAEHLLLSMQNHERLGINSLPSTDRPLGIALDQETLELIKKLNPKK